MAEIGKTSDKGTSAAYSGAGRNQIRGHREHDSGWRVQDNMTGPVRQEAADPAGQPVPDGLRQDRTQWSPAAVRGGWQEQAGLMLEQLKKQYPGITFHMAQGEDCDLSGLAVKAGSGMHLYLTQAFMERMGSSREEAGRCLAALSAAAERLKAGQNGNISSGAYLGEDEAAYWAVPGESQAEALTPMVKDSQEEGRARSQDYRVSASLSLNVSSQFSRLARARSRGQVREAMWDVHRCISNLKMAAVYGDQDQRVKASRAIRSLQKLLGRGGRKLRRLDREQLKQQAQKKAEKNHKEHRARRLKQELKQMRSGRLGSDCSLVKEGMADEAYIHACRRYREARDEYGRQSLAGDIPGLFQPGTGGIGGSQEGADAGFTAADVVVSEPAPF